MAPLDVMMLFDDTPDYLAALVVDEASIIRASHALLLAVVFMTTIAAFAFLGPVLDMLFVGDIEIVVDESPGLDSSEKERADSIINAEPWTEP